MIPCASILLDFNLPNATTWFYFALLLAIALFFKFSRLLSVRNGDVLALFLLMPGFLLLQQGERLEKEAEPLVRDHVAYLAVAQPFGPGAYAAVSGVLTAQTAVPRRWFWFGYLWLLCGSAYLLGRCLLDLALERRPALAPNLNFGGLAWLAGALFVSLGAVAVRNPDSSAVGSPTVAVQQTQLQAKTLVQLGTVGQTRDAIAFWAERLLAVAAHLAVVIGLMVIGWRHFQDLSAGMAAATLYLLLPYTALHVHQTHHVLPTAFLVWAVAAYQLPTLAGALLGLAVATGYYPLVVVPLWFSFYWRRGAGRFTGALVLTLLFFLAGAGGFYLLIKDDFADALARALAEWRRPLEAHKGFWAGIRWAWAYRLPVFIAHVAFVIATLFWPARKNLAHLLALSAALVLGIQFWHADQGGVYVLWYLPLLTLLVFRPNLADRQPALIVPENDWLVRLRRAVGRAAAALVRPPEPVVRVH